MSSAVSSRGPSPAAAPDAGPRAGAGDQPAPRDATGRGERPPPPVSAGRGGPTGWIVLALLPPLLLAGFWRTWQQLFAFEHGLDATLPGFTRYWMSIFVLNVAVLPLAVSVAYARLWWTGRHMADEPMDDATEVRRIWTLWLILLSLTVAVYLGGSYFAEQDAAWHQVTLRDTAFTPSHIGLFYGSFPLMFYLSVGAFLYGRTRLPHLFGGRTIPLAFLLLVAGPVLLLFQVAFNEFGHTFWETEEIFNAPLHWPFIVFAYLLGAAGAVLLTTIPRLLDIARREGLPTSRLGMPHLSRRWDLVGTLMIVLLVAGAAHMQSSLLNGEWSFWADWKDRQWWPLVTPAVTIVIAGLAQHLLWERFRLPVGATFATVTLAGAQWVSRTTTFEGWANLPISFTAPETMIVLGVLLDVVLVLSRSYVLTSLVGGALFGSLFFLANLPAIAPLHQPVVLQGHVLTVADMMGFAYPRSQGPEYLRIIEEGHLRALVGNVTIIVAFFAGMLSALTWWVGYWLSRLLVFRPVGRHVELFTDTGDGGPVAPQEARA